MSQIVRKPLARELQWFPEARFGMFIHFGLYSLLERGEWVQYHEWIPRKKYEKLMRRFTITNFDADAWVDLARAAGARYITFTTKHHDGFCLFDSALTDFKITNTPFGRDLTGELIAACHRKRMRIILYHSQPDWHHPNHVHRPGAFKDWQPARGDDEPDWEKYLDYLEGQVRELCTNYGRIDGIWWDGCHRRESDWRGKRLYCMIKKYQPHAVVNDRAGCGDFFTPERNIPELPRGYACECCQAVHVKSWGYNRAPYYHSTDMLVRSLSRVVCMGGNYLLNVGPRPDGTIAHGEAERMREIGKWMKTNREAVYATRGCGLDTNSDQVRATRKGNRVYLFLLDWPGSNVLTLPGIRSLPRRVRLLGSRSRLSFNPAENGIVKQAGKKGSRSNSNQGLEISNLPATAPGPLVQVLELDFTRAPDLVMRKPDASPAPRIPVAAKGDTFLGVEHAKAGNYGPKGSKPRAFNLVPAGTSGKTSGPDCMVISNFAEGQTLTWIVHCSRAGIYEVFIDAAIDRQYSGRSRFSVQVGKQVLPGRTRGRKTDRDFSLNRVGTVKLAKGGNRIRFRIEELHYSYLFGGNLRGLVIRRGA